MKNILTLIFILTTFFSKAGGLDSTSILFNKSPEREINLHLRSHNSELSTNGYLTAISGLGFITTGFLLERKRIERNVPDGYFGYSKSRDMGLNYFITSLGAGLTVTGVIMIRKAYKK
jgi:hypothetical protein